MNYKQVKIKIKTEYIKLVLCLNMPELWKQAELARKLSLKKE